MSSVQRVVCGGCLDFKVVTKLSAAAFGEWEKAKFAPEAAMFASEPRVLGSQPRVFAIRYELLPPNFRFRKEHCTFLARFEASELDSWLQEAFLQKLKAIKGIQDGQ